MSEYNGKVITHGSYSGTSTPCLTLSRTTECFGRCENKEITSDIFYDSNQNGVGILMLHLNALWICRFSAFPSQESEITSFQDVWSIEDSSEHRSLPHMFVLPMITEREATSTCISDVLLRIFSPRKEHGLHKRCLAV